jgi:hypothetical protein
MSDSDAEQLPDEIKEVARSVELNLLPEKFINKPIEISSFFGKSRKLSYIRRSFAGWFWGIIKENETFFYFYTCPKTKVNGLMSVIL